MNFFNKFSSFNKAIKACDNKVTSKKNNKILNVKTEKKNYLSIKTRLKACFYLISKDKRNFLKKHFFKNPFLYSYRLFLSIIKRSSFYKNQDYYYFNLINYNDLRKKLSNKSSILILGFSYCHKPFNFPSKRFTDKCIKEHNNQI